MELRLPSPCLVVLVGPSGAGKSHWAAANFEPSQIVSSDDLRALVGEAPHDLRASNDAFEVLESVLDRRLRRGLLTVVDSLGLERDRRERYAALSLRYGVAAHAVVFDTAPQECRRRNSTRSHPVPARVLAGQLAQMPAVRAALGEEGYTVHEPGAVRIVPATFADAPAHAAIQRDTPVTLRFGLQIPRFTWEGGPAAVPGKLAAIANAAEGAGFTSLWVMDHFVQIPQAGREWEDMLDSYTTLAFLAAHTREVTLGALVTGVTYRNIAHLAKIVATLDVLSGGRAVCGLGAAWYEREHRAYGWPFPPARDRFAMLEDALELLPLMWGPGAPRFEGRTITVAEALCYPRPIQGRIPLLVGGGGERRTLRLAARYANACNWFGDAATVTHKREVLQRHCADVGRDVGDIEITHLSTVLAAPDPASLRDTVEPLRSARESADQFSRRVNAATVEDHIGRFRQLADAGVQTAIVNLPNVEDPSALHHFAAVIDAFRSTP